MSTNNPYAAPQFAVEPVPVFSQYSLASQGQRFINLVIDQIMTQVVSLVAGIAIGIVFVATNGPEADPQGSGIQIVSAVSGIGISLAYYLVMEAVFGRTVGKFVTGTRVVTVDGRRASFGQVLGRTLCRLIPFEAFSFLGKDAVGWHDSIPKTRVIKVR